MRGIVLDQTYAETLLNSAASKIGGDLGGELLNEVLFALLMYDKVWLSGTLGALLNCETGRLLASEGMVSLIPEAYLEKANDFVIKGIDSYSSSLSLGAPYTAEDYLDLDRVLEFDLPRFEYEILKRQMQYVAPAVYGMSKLHQRYPSLQSYVDKSVGELPLTDYLIRSLEDESVLDVAASADAMIDGYRSFAEDDAKQFVADHIEGCYTNEQKLETVLELLEEFKKPDDAYTRYSSHEKAVEKLEELYRESAIRDLREDIQKLRDLCEFIRADEVLSFSSSECIPVKANVPVWQNSSVRSSMQSEEYSYGVFQTVLAEVDRLPRFDSVIEVLKYRNHPAIQNFRNAIYEWTSCWTGNAMQSEQRIRSSIRSAVRDLGTVGTYRRIGGWVTWVSVPASCLGLVPGIAISVLAGGVSAGAYHIANNLEKKNRWLMFGPTSM